MNAASLAAPHILAFRAGALAAAAVAASVAAGCGGDGGASELSVGPGALALRGTTTTYLEVEADGGWLASAEPSWLSVEPTEGDGNETLTVTVDRQGLEIDAYAGSIAITGAADVGEAVPVLMKFPEIDGNVQSPGGNLQPRRRGGGPPAERRPGVDYVAGEILVGLDKELVAIEEHGLTAGPVDPDLEPSLQAMQLAAETVGARVGARQIEIISPTLGLAKLKIDTPEVEAAIAEIERDGRARYAATNDLMELQAVNDTHYELQWHYRSINLEEAWEVTTGYEETIVSVIDADFHPNHPDLAGNLLPGYDFVRDSEDIEIFNEDCNSHGTHVAGTVAAVTDNDLGVAGVAPRARILPLNITRENECGLPSAASIRAIMYSAGAPDLEAGQLDRPVDVINMSFGGSSPNDARAEALKFARDAGVVLLASSGNDGRDGDPVIYPAAQPMVGAIAATDINDNRAPYSSYGPEVWVAAPGGNSEQNIPGTDHSARVLSTAYVYDGADSRNTYTFKQGTSMASPHASGVAALIRSVNPDLSPAVVLEILAQTATDLGDPGRDEEYGHGLINAEAAVTVARDSLSVRTDEVIVRILQGGEILAEAEADIGGAFELGPLAAGEYTLQAGSLRDGELDRPGTVYGEQTITVDYSGNHTLLVDVDPR